MKRAKEFLKHRLKTGVCYLGVIAMIVCNQNSVFAEQDDKEMKIDIVVAAQAPEPVKFAASELSGYLGRITGGQPFVVADGKGVFLVAVATDESVPAGIRERLKGHGPEAFVVESDGDRLFLVGNSPRAVVYAVYHFLEKYLGCRWYTPDPAEEIVPRCPVADIRSMLKAGIHDLEKPDFSVRMWEYRVFQMRYKKTPLTEAVMRQLPDLVAWMPKLRVNIFQFEVDYTGDVSSNYPFAEFKKVIPELHRRGLEAGMAGHCQSIFMDNKKLKENPDWQIFRDGARQEKGKIQLFCTSNNDAVEHYIGNMVAFLKANPGITWFAPWPNDNNKWCECPQCVGTSVSDRLMRLEKLVFERLKKEIPNVRYSAFAYADYAKPPTKEKLLPGMTVTYCTICRDCGIPFDNERTPKNIYSAFSGWRDICRQANADLVLQEMLGRLMFMGPQFCPLPVLEQDMRFYQKEGVAGFELPANYMGLWAKSLNWVALSRLMWNADTSVKEMTADFFAHFYSPCSNEVARIYALVESGSDYSGYGRNKALFSKKAGDDCGDVRPYFERNVKQFGQAREETRALCLQFKENADLSYRLGHLQTVLDYCFDEFSVILEIINGADDALCAKKNISDQVLYKSQTAEARRHFESAGRMFDSLQQRYYADPKEFSLIWDLQDNSNGRFKNLIAGWLGLLDAKDVKVISEPPRPKGGALLAGQWRRGAFSAVTKSLSVN